MRELHRQPGSSLFLSGPAFSGKSHLLNALCVEQRERGASAWYIGLESLGPGDSGVLSGLQGMVCLDGLHAVAGDRRWAEALFHSFNEIREGGGQIAASSRQPLSAMTFALPDLASRMAWGLRFRLLPLDESGRLEVLRLHARRLELELPQDVERFLLRRIGRDLGSLLKAVEKLHHGALAGKRRVTVPFTRQVLSAELGRG